MGNEYVLVRGGTWQGLYKNGLLLTEDHRINFEEALNHIVATGGINKFSSVDCSFKWIDNLGNFPKLLSEVKIIDD